MDDCSGEILGYTMERLLAAGERLIAVIKRCEGRPNKDLSRFTDQINNLCDKWEK